MYFDFRFWESGRITRALSALLAILADALLRAVRFYFCRALAAESCNHNLLNNQLTEHKDPWTTDKEAIFLCLPPYVSAPKMVLWLHGGTGSFLQTESAKQVLLQKATWALSFKPWWLRRLGNVPTVISVGLVNEYLRWKRKTWPSCLADEKALVLSWDPLTTLTRRLISLTRHRLQRAVAREVSSQ